MSDEAGGDKAVSVAGSTGSGSAVSDAGRFVLWDVGAVYPGKAVVIGLPHSASNTGLPVRTCMKTSVPLRSLRTLLPMLPSFRMKNTL
jgi:hypothetical protein